MPKRDESAQKIGLADAIAELRAELSRARKEGEGSDIRFAPKEITVELALEFGRNVEGGGGVKVLSFLDFSGKAGASDKIAHKVTLKLEIASGGVMGDTLVADDDNPHAPKPKR
jgi:hypothetical protein